MITITFYPQFPIGILRKHLRYLSQDSFGTGRRYCAARLKVDDLSHISHLGPVAQHGRVLLSERKLCKQQEHEAWSPIQQSTQTHKRMEAGVANVSCSFASLNSQA